VRFPRFVQTITIRSDNPDRIVALAQAWDDLQSSTDVMGYVGTQVLADRDEPGRYLIVANFAQVDPDVTAWEEAMKNNDRPETQQWAEQLRELAVEEPGFANYDELYRTG
jgi:hypothetical protein